MDKRIIYGIGGIALIALAFIYFQPDLDDSLLEARYYDSSMNRLFSIVGDVEGVSYIDFVATVTNTGELPLTVSIDQATPPALSSALTVSNEPLAPGETREFTSDVIDVAPFEGSIQEFFVRVRADYTYGGSTDSIYKEGSVTLQILEDPDADFTLGFTSSVGSEGTGTNGTCSSSGASCSDGSECCSESCLVAGEEMTVLQDQTSACTCPYMTCPATGYDYCFMDWPAGYGNVQPGDSSSQFGYNTGCIYTSTEPCVMYGVNAAYECS